MSQTPRGWRLLTMEMPTAASLCLATTTNTATRDIDVFALPPKPQYSMDELQPDISEAHFSLQASPLSSWGPGIPPEQETERGEMTQARTAREGAVPRFHADAQAFTTGRVQ